MLSLIKHRIRRFAQKIMGLDADNSAIEKINRQLFELKSELENIKNDFLFNARLVPNTIENFTEPSGFFNIEDKLVSELISLGLVNKNCNVLELMCGEGIKANILSKNVKSYLGYDSSEILINFLKTKIPQANFTFDRVSLEVNKYDLVIISSKPSRWSILSTKELIDLAKKLINPNGKIIIELPYPEVTIAEFEKLRYEAVTFLVSDGNNLKISNLTK